MKRRLVFMISACTVTLRAFASITVGTESLSFVPPPNSTYTLDVQTNVIACLEEIVGLWTNKSVYFYDESQTTGELDIQDAALAPLPSGTSIPCEFTRSAQGILEIAVPDDLLSAYTAANEVISRYTNAVSRLPEFVAAINNRSYTNTPPAQIRSWVYTPGVADAAYEQMANKWVSRLNDLNIQPYTRFSFYVEPANTYGFETETLWARLPSRLPHLSIWGCETELIYAVWFDNAWHIAWIPV